MTSGGGQISSSVVARVVDWVRPQVSEASDGILTAAGIAEGFAGAGASTKTLILAGLAGIISGTLATAAVEYSKVGAERDQQLQQLAGERAELAAAPDTELDELTALYAARGLSAALARQVAEELTARDALSAHAEAEYGITPESRARPLRDALAVGAAFTAGTLLPWLAIILIPGPPRAAVTFAIVLAALVLTGWISAEFWDVHPARPILRTVAIGAATMAITYGAGRLIHP